MDVFDLVAKITLDDKEYKEQLEGSKKDTKNFASKLGSGLKTAAKVAGVALVAAGTAAVALGKQAVQAYADYEQLVGGVETLFGTGGKTLQEYADSSGQSIGQIYNEYKSLERAQAEVMKNAANAYQTAGLSANEYMETVTSFSASLIQSLGGDTEAAAKYADMAITDMSDSANKMGTDMSAIQSAYQGFAKQNYTMLDNLKLGYGGTKTEMERLIKDAENLDSSFKAARDENGELAMSYSDIVDAIHIVQTDIGITGTTAKEAAETISGSTSAMKAAWKNLITGLADDNSDFDSLISGFLGSVTTVAKNIIPRVQVALNGISKMISDGAGEIIPLVVETVVQNLPALIEAASAIVSSLVDAIAQNFPALIDAGLEIVLKLADGIADNVETLVPAVITAVLTIVNKLTDPSTVMQLTQAAMRIIMAIAGGLIKALPQILMAAAQILAALFIAFEQAASQLVEAGHEILIKLMTGISNFLHEVIAKGKEIVSKLVEGVKASWGKITTAGKEIIDRIKEGISEKWGELTSWFSNLWDRLFQNRKVSVDVETEDAPGHAIGLDYVPTNRYLAELHRGEAVLTAHEADEWRRGRSGTAEYDPNVALIVDLLEEIIANGLNANVDRRGLYNAVRTENRTRTRATNYNALALA